MEEVTSARRELLSRAERRVGESRRSASLAVVIPTFNERENVPVLVEALERALAGDAWEAVFVDDDSPDGTALVVQEIARGRPEVRCLQRIGRRGLASAVVEGILSTSAPYVAVMDADLQHDESLLPAMLHLLESDRADLVVGSRYVEGGRTDAWSRRRRRASRLASRLGRLVLPVPLADPLSGFFMMRRGAFEAVVRNLSATGYKILLDVLVSAPRDLRVVELPYAFRARRVGESKVDSVVVWEYGLLLLDKALGGRLPSRFLGFALVGASGALVHLGTLGVLRQVLGWPFPAAQAAATWLAMTNNFSLNNALTYRDRRLRGRAWLRGLATFYAICALGAIANVGVSSVLFQTGGVWWVAGSAGLLIGAVWNFAMSANFAWSPPRPGRPGG